MRFTVGMNIRNAIKGYGGEKYGKEERVEDMVTIRLAAEQDYDAVERIMRQVHNMHVDWRPDIYIDTDPILPHDMYMAHLAEGQAIVAEAAGEVVGLVIYLTRNISGGPMKARRVLFVDSMAVEERYRGQGIGHKLFDYVLQLCRERRYDGLELRSTPETRRQGLCMRSMVLQKNLSIWSFWI